MFIVPSFRAEATTIPVAAGDNLTAYTPGNGDVLALQGDATLYRAGQPLSTMTLPPSLTINGVPAGSTIAMNDGAGNYGAFATTSPVTLMLSNVTLTGSHAASVGVFGSNLNAVFNSSGSVAFVGNSALSGSGGAVFVSGSLTVNSSGGSMTFSGNSTSGFGGAVYAGSALTFTDSTQLLVVRDNTATLGGGGLNAGGSVSVAGGVVLDHNIANGSNGGGIRSVAGNVSMGTTAGDVTLTRNSTVAAGTNGGAIFAGGGNVALGNTGGLVTIGGTATTGNSAANGGGVYSGGATTITGKAVTVSNNQATTGNGGGIYSAGTTGLTGSSITLSNNTAGAAGGGIYSGGAATINGNLTANANKAQAGNGGAIVAASGGVAIYGGISADGNTASDRGGAIHAAAGNIDVVGSSGGIVSLTNNSAVNGGGALFAQTGSISMTGAYGPVAISGNKATTGVNSNGGALSTFAGGISFTPSTAGDVTLTGNTAAGGGGVFYGKAGIMFSPGQAGKLVVSDNVADGYGSGAFSTSGTNAHITFGGTYDSLLFTNNRATTGYGGVFTVSGGTGSNVVIDAATAGSMAFRANHARLNGGAVNSDGVSIKGHYGGIVFDGNIAETGHGGALHGNTVTIDTTTSGSFSLTANHAGQFGGAINTFAAQIQGSYGAILMDGNTAGAAGGAIHGTSAVIDTMTTGALTMSNNVAAQGGGAIDTNVAQILGSYGSIAITGNTAATVGGAINSNVNDITVNATVVGAMAISGNKAGGGGAFAANSGNIAVSGSYGGLVIDGNKALSGNGGAFFATGNVAVTNSAGAITLSNNTAATDGGALYSGGAMTLAGTAVNLQNNTAGSGSGGAVYATKDFTLTVTSGTTVISDNSAALKGGAISAGRNLTLNALGGDVSFSGNSHSDPMANAIYLNNTGAAGAVATFNTQAGNTISFYDPIENNVANGLVSVVKSGEGLLSFDGSRYSAEVDRWSKIYGSTEVQAGSFEVANNAVYGVLAADVGQSSPSTFTSAAGTTVQGGVMGTLRADNITLNGDLNIAGRQPGTRGVFNLTSSNLTLGGGNIYFNTFLNDGVVQNTDLLVLNLENSSVHGAASLIVTPVVGSPGTLTVGDGIKLVQTNNGSSGNAFALGSRVAAGAYEYLLFHGGNASAGGDPNNGNWYLRNTAPPEPPVPPSPPAPAPAPEVPIIRPEVPTAMVIAPVALEYGFTLLDTLHQRMGETWLAGFCDSGLRLRWQGCPRNTDLLVQSERDQVRWASGAWGRLIGTHEQNRPNDLDGRGPNYTHDTVGAQVGLDVYTREQGDGTFERSGGYLGYGQIDADVDARLGTTAGMIPARVGGVKLDAYSLGAYWTHFSPKGWYSDAVLQGTWYASRASSVYGSRIEPDGWGLAASLEGGYPFYMSETVTLEPQAQLVVQRVKFEGGQDAFGSFDFGNTDSVRARLGARLTRTWLATDEIRPRLITGWLRANVWHEFSSDATTTAATLWGTNPVAFTSSLGGTWGEVGAGLSGQVSDAATVHANLGYEHSLDGRGRQGWSARIGVTYKW